MAPPDGYASSSSFPPAHYSSPAAGGGGNFDPLTSTPSKPSSPPPEFSFDTPGRNVQPLVLPAPGQHAHRPYGGLGLPYGAPPYTGTLGQGFGFRLPSSQSYRTAYVGSTAPLRFGTSNPAGPQSPYRQYQPWPISDSLPNLGMLRKSCWFWCETLKSEWLQRHNLVFIQREMGPLPCFC